jgi:hypothetical protein
MMILVKRSKNILRCACGCREEIVEGSFYIFHKVKNKKVYYLASHTADLFDSFTETEITRKFSHKKANKTKTKNSKLGIRYADNYISLNPDKEASELFEDLLSNLPYSIFRPLAKLITENEQYFISREIEGGKNG